MIKIMEKKYKHFVSIFILLGLFLVSQVTAFETCDLDITMVNQDSYPAIPGEYVDVLFQVSGLENPGCNGAYFELIPSYPFSVDESQELIHILKGNTWISNSKSEWLIPCKLRIDSNAIDGNSTINIKYGELKGNTIQEFKIKIEDLTTDFDAVIQDSSSSEISIAIANVGKYTANSVVVRIPEQDNFRATSTDGQMVGNLDSGDYTIVNFDIESIQQRNMETTNSFDFDLYYTDSLGERRIVNMELNLKMTRDQMNMTSIPGDYMSRKGSQSSSGSNNNWIWYIVILTILGVIFTIYKKIGINNLKIKFKKSKKDSTLNIPNWISKESKK